MTEETASSSDASRRDESPGAEPSPEPTRRVIPWAELVVVGIILLVALALRLHDLSSLPGGFHGDEAVVGLESQRILDDGSIGPYSEQAAGQPTGPMYVFALAVALLGNDVVAVRVVSAVVGTLTVLALYLALRRVLTVEIAITGASLLAVMSWHLHFSRIAYPLIFWPLLAVLIGIAVDQALRTLRPGWWIAAGALIGSGIYVYNAHPLLALVSVLVIVLWMVARDREDAVRRHGPGLALAALAGLVILVPMLHYIQEDPGRYREHFQEASVFERPEWTELETNGQRAEFLARAYGSYWKRLCCTPKLDVVDATGLVPVLPFSLLVLSAIGIPIALRRYRLPIVWFGVVVVVILPVSTIITEGGLARRTFVIVPFLAMFAAIALSTVFSSMQQRGRVARWAAAIVVAVAFGMVSFQSLHVYFGEFAAANVEERALGLPMADAARFIDTLPDEHYVYFLSNTWSFDYVTRTFLAPDREGEDRSREFGRYSLAVSERNGTPIFVLLGHYLSEIDALRRLYPGGEVLRGHGEEAPTFVAYRVVLPEPEPPVHQIGE